MSKPVEPVIRLCTYDDAPIVTVAEYEALEKEIVSRHLCGDAGHLERIVARLLTNHRGRYLEAKAILAAR